LHGRKLAENRKTAAKINEAALTKFTAATQKINGS